MIKLDFEGAKAYALERLENELPTSLYYHSLPHTRDDVAPGVERLALKYEIDGAALGLVKTAAYFHDIGFIKQVVDHEIASIQIAEKILPKFGLRPEHLQQISRMILATRLPQSPRSFLERILMDADLDVLGRDDFLSRSKDLRAELAANGLPTTEEAWYKRQLAFLKRHRYFTAAARDLRETTKQQNIAILENLLAQSQVMTRG